MEFINTDDSLITLVPMQFINTDDDGDNDTCSMVSSSTTTTLRDFQLYQDDDGYFSDDSDDELMSTDDDDDGDADNGDYEMKAIKDEASIENVSLNNHAVCGECELSRSLKKEADQSHSVAAAEISSQ
jgi:hypothetical protein